MADDGTSKKESTWNWAYLIPMTALMIPVVAITGFELSDVAELARALSLPLAIVATVGGAVFAGRNLLGYRHQLRMKEIAGQQEIARIETARLEQSNRLLDLDDRLTGLRDQGTTELET